MAALPKQLAKLLVVWALPLSAASPVLFEGERLIVDARRPPIENAALLIDNGRVVGAERKGTVKAPASCDRPRARFLRPPFAGQRRACPKNI